MRILLDWLQSVVSDFMALSPTAQMTFAIGGLTFLAAFIVGAAKSIAFLRKTNKEDAQRESVESERARILRLLENNRVSTSDAIELARLLYSGTAVSEGSALEEVISRESSEQTVSALTSGDEERLAFAATVKELATSDDFSDRAVILQYARGDRAAAINMLEARAKSAGKNGADIWREMATLALPFDHEKAVMALQQAADLDRTDVVSMCRLSRAFSRVGDNAAAKEAAERALDRAQDDSLRGRALYRLAHATLQMGDTGEAARLAKAAVDAARKGSAELPDDEDRARVLANAYEILSDTQVALGSYFEANASLDKAVKLFEYLLKLSPDDEEVMLDRFRAVTAQGYLEWKAGSSAAAVALLDKVIPEIRNSMTDQPQNRWFAESYGAALLYRALALCDLGREEEAMEQAREVELLSEKQIKADHTQLNARNNRLWAQIYRVRMLYSLGRVKDAEELRDVMIAHARKDVAIGTDNARRNLAVALMEDGDLRLDLGDMLGAEESYKESFEITEGIAKYDAASVDKREEVLLAAWKLANHARAQDEYVTYQRIAADTLKSAQQLLADYPFAPRLKADVAYAHEVMADAAGCLGDEGGFLEHAEKAKNLRDALEKANPDDFQVRLCAIETTRLLAAGFSDAGQEKRATEMVEEALAALEVLADTPEKAERLAGSRALCLIVLSSIHERSGEFDEANQAHLDALALVRARYETAPELQERRMRLISTLTSYGDLLKGAQRTEEARAHFQQALDLAESTSNNPNRSEVTSKVVALQRLASCEEIIGNKELADQIYAQYRTTAEELAEEDSDLNAQGNLAIAYVNEAVENLSVGSWKDAEDWLSKAKTVSEKIPAEQQIAQHVRYLVTNAALELALHFGEGETFRKHIDTLVAIAKKKEVSQPSLINTCELCDQMIRQVSLHNVYGQPNAYFAEMAAAVEAAERRFGEKVLARPQLAALWERLGRLCNQLGKPDDAIAAFEKVLVAYPPNLNTDRPVQLANVLSELAATHVSVDAFTAAESCLTKVDALIPVIQDRYDQPHFAIYQKIEIAQNRARIALLTGALKDARNHALDMENSAMALECELPGHADPFLHLFNAIDIEAEALLIEGKIQDAGPTYDRLVNMALRSVDVFGSTRIQKDIDCHVALLRSLIDCASGEYQSADEAARSALDTILVVYEEEPTAFRRSLMGSLRQAISEALVGLGEVTDAIAMQRKANADFHLITIQAPKLRADARRYLHGLFVLSRLTKDEEDFNELKRFFVPLEEFGGLPAHFDWVIEMKAEVGAVLG